MNPSKKFSEWMDSFILLLINNLVLNKNRIKFLSRKSLQNGEKGGNIFYEGNSVDKWC